MKKLVLLALLASTPALANHKNPEGGQCRANATAAIETLAKLNQVTGDLTLALHFVNGTQETYSAGGFTIELDTGSNGYAPCSVTGVGFTANQN